MASYLMLAQLTDSYQRDLFIKRRHAWFVASTKDPSLPIQNSDHAMLARCAALCAACS
ncbi:hypothetical protein J6590_074860 [Homalodisca vitripennis]|nr:hypothetical protein J6590_074860 [Homalodisca vitripennis]